MINFLDLNKEWPKELLEIFKERTNERVLALWRKECGEL